MGKFLKPGKVVICTSGKHAGKKAVIVKNWDDGTQDRPYGHCLVAGILRYPKPIRKGMSHKKMVRRTRVWSFLKVVNYSHMMPTRYSLDLPIDKSVVNMDSVKDGGLRKDAIMSVKTTLQERYLTGKNRWFFSRLRF